MVAEPYKPRGGEGRVSFTPNTKITEIGVTLKGRVKQAIEIKDS